MARSSSKPSRKTPKRKTPASRAPASRQADWVNLKVAWPQRKEAISLRIDQDILAWFRDRGPGYQTRINAVLRAFVDAQQPRR